MGVGVVEAMVVSGLCYLPSRRKVISSFSSSYAALHVSSPSSLVFPLNCLKLSLSSSDWLGGDNAGEIDSRETLRVLAYDATSLCFANRFAPSSKHPTPCANILVKSFFLESIASGSRNLHHGHTAKITHVDAFAVRRLPRDKQD